MNNKNAFSSTYLNISATKNYFMDFKIFGKYLINDNPMRTTNTNMHSLLVSNQIRVSHGSEEISDAHFPRIASVIL